MVLAADRKTPSRNGKNFSFPVDGGSLIYQGALVGLNALGYLVPASAIATIRIIGRALEQVDNVDGADGALRCEVETGVFRWDNSSAGDAISLLHVGRTVFAVDDETVALTEGASGNRPAAGVVVDVDDEGVWVASGAGSEGGTSDAAIAGGTNLITDRIEDNVSANAYVMRYVHRGPAAEIRSIATVIDRALTGGNETITAAINGVAVTGGVVTITQAGSAAGDVDLAEPTAANVMEEGDVLTLTVGGTQTSTALRVDVTVELGY